MQNLTVIGVGKLLEGHEDSKHPPKPHSSPYYAPAPKVGGTK